MAIFIFFSLFIALSSLAYSVSSPVSYSDHCNSLVPETIPTNLSTNVSNRLQFVTSFYFGGHQIFDSKSADLKSANFQVHATLRTHAEDVIKVEGKLEIQSAERYLALRRPFRRRWDRHSALMRKPQVSGFNLEGFWSRSSGKLCMVGSGNGHSREGYVLDLSVVFKLGYPKNSSSFMSFVSGSLESVDKTDSLNYFEPVSLLAFSSISNYSTLVSKETKTELSSGGVDEKGLAISSALSHGIDKSSCPVLRGPDAVFELEYGIDCNDARNGSPIEVGNGFLPSLMSFRGVQCSVEERSTLVIGFYDSTVSAYHQTLVPDRMLVGKGVWDEGSNRFNIVACRILNVTGSLPDASFGDCSIRLSLWFPAILTIKTRSIAIGQIWSNRRKGDSGYFDRIMFRSSSDRRSEVPGLKYEYTEINRVKKACKENSGGNKERTYPGAPSSHMTFSIKVGHNVRNRGRGTPVTVGDQFYKSSFGVPRFGISQEPGLKVHGIKSSILNVSYVISLRPSTYFKLGGQFSLANTSNKSPRTSVLISAEGVYNTRTGSLCMIGCRYLGSNYYRSYKNGSMDCEMLINVQFPELNTKQMNFVKGSIKSTRERSDTLYFEPLEFSSAVMSRTAAEDYVWRVDLEITMVLIAKTLICLSVGRQLLYVKKHHNVLPSISLVMLIILTLGLMVPLLLNFEAVLLTNRNHRNVFVGTGGWLEVNEVLVRLVTMIAFILQFYLLQQTWSSRLNDGNKKSLWLAEEKALYVYLPLCLLGGLISWIIHWQRTRYDKQISSLLGDLKTYARLLLDGFLLPQILLNVFWNSNGKALTRTFYLGITALRILPHAYDFYTDHWSQPGVTENNLYRPYFGGQMISVGHGMDRFTAAWNTIIPCGGLLFAVIIYFQQRFGGSCLLPPKFRKSIDYEKLPVVNASGQRL